MPAVGRRAGLSERAYAMHTGVSRGCVQKACLSGRLVLCEDGSIDAAGSDVQRAQASDPARQRGRHGMTARPVPREAVDMSQREQDLPALAEGGGMTYLQVRTINEVLKVQERRIDVKSKRDKLVNRARAVALVFRLAREERDAWLGWPARIAAQMAATWVQVRMRSNRCWNGMSGSISQSRLTFKRPFVDGIDLRAH